MIVCDTVTKHNFALFQKLECGKSLWEILRLKGRVFHHFLNLFFYFQFHIITNLNKIQDALVVVYFGANNIGNFIAFWWELEGSGRYLLFR